MTEYTDFAGADTSWVCSRKKAYHDPKFAKQVARKVSETRGVEVVAYACTRCGSWHIGRQPGSTDR